MSADRANPSSWIGLFGPILLLTCSLALLTGARDAGAVGPYLTSFNELYGTSGTRVDTCGVCHVNFSNNSEGRNSFGTAFEMIPMHAADPIQALVGMEGGDPDGDGTLSGAEIELLFLPGWSCTSVDSAVKAPADVALYVDPANPGCAAPPETETNCFDTIDDDGDDLPDCADPDCDSVIGGICDTALAGACAAGTLSCRDGNEACSPDQLPVPEGPFGDPTCSDAVDGDCDGLTDQEESSCQVTLETSCFDGVDDDLDGFLDCEDPDCAGATLGSCDTGEVGVCATGTTTCAVGVAECAADRGSETEGPGGEASCSDGLDNDCDSLVDLADGDCAPGWETDVYALSLRVPKALKLRTGRAASRRVVVTADGDVAPQEVTVELFVDPIQAVTVAVDPSFVTGSVEPGAGASRFRFDTHVTCLEAGTWRLEWTATIQAAENRDALDDVLTATTKLTCR
jgi:hypothetical protein